MFVPIVKIQNEITPDISQGKSHPLQKTVKTYSDTGVK